MVLLALAAWLMSRGDKEKPTVRPRKIEFPRYPKPARGGARQPSPQRCRRCSRRRPASKRRNGKRDPVLAALPADPKRSAMVFEIEAPQRVADHADSGSIACCRAARRAAPARARLKDRYGIDVLEDVERIAASSTGLMVLQGSFEGARFERERWSTRTYGERGVSTRKRTRAEASRRGA